MQSFLYSQITVLREKPYKSYLHASDRGGQVVLSQVDGEGVLGDLLRWPAALDGGTVSSCDHMLMGYQCAAADVVVVHPLKQLIKHEL